MDTSVASASAIGNATRDLAVARELARLGVPVFVAALKPDGYPVPPRQWEQTEPDPRHVNRWQPGMALCAVGGQVFDILDIDPRHGGDESLNKLREQLGADRPKVYARATTPSGGWHLWLAPLGIAKHSGFWPGLDLQGGKPDGSGRGFAFIPPTVRPSKVTGLLAPYRWLEPPGRIPADDTTGRALAEIILAAAKPVQPALRPVATDAATGTARVSLPYVRAAVEAELIKVAEAPEGARNDTLNKAAWSLGRFAAAGLLDPDVLADALTEAADAAGISAYEAGRTIASAFRGRGVAA